MERAIEATTNRSALQPRCARLTMATNNNLEDGGLVIVDYAEIVQDPLSTHTLLGPKLAQAFGSDGMGLIAIRNVPGFVASKRALLPHGPYPGPFARGLFRIERGEQ
eukprot:scaffold2373_cov53-Attheya_sp.AAC.4